MHCTNAFEIPVAWMHLSLLLGTRKEKPFKDLWILGHVQSLRSSSKCTFSWNIYKDLLFLYAKVVFEKKFISKCSFWLKEVFQKNLGYVTRQNTFPI